ncbi:MAG: DUF559 domain-containing protein [Nitrosomonas sp.]
MLTRLATEPGALAQVATKALEVMHYKRPENGVWDAQNLQEDIGAGDQANCEAGCYKCLLSYYNQPDHSVIDRKDAANNGKALDILCRLTRANGEVGNLDKDAAEHLDELRRISGSSLEREWLDYIEKHGYLKPDRGQETIARCQTCADFYYHDWKAAIYIDGPHHDEPTQREKDETINRCLDDAGYVVIRFPKEPSRWQEIFVAHADLFGTGK